MSVFLVEDGNVRDGAVLNADSSVIDSMPDTDASDAFGGVCMPHARIIGDQNPDIDVPFRAWPGDEFFCIHLRICVPVDAADEVAAHPGIGECYPTEGSPCQRDGRVISGDRSGSGVYCSFVDAQTPLVDPTYVETVCELEEAGIFVTGSCPNF